MDEYEYHRAHLLILILGHCFFCEGVTPELFIKNNVVDFVKNLPTNPYSTTKRRESRSPSKDIRSDNAQSPLLDNVHIDESLHIKNLQSERSANSIYQVDSDSSDDESDSVDIGFKRKRRNRTKSNWEKREATSQRRIRSLSEAICDIEARTKAAKEEMDKIVSRTQSESTTSGVLTFSLLHFLYVFLFQ